MSRLCQSSGESIIVFINRMLFVISNLWLCDWSCSIYHMTFGSSKICTYFAFNELILFFCCLKVLTLILLLIREGGVLRFSPFVWLDSLILTSCLTLWDGELFLNTHCRSVMLLVPVTRGFQFPKWPRFCFSDSINEFSQSSVMKSCSMLLVHSFWSRNARTYKYKNSSNPRGRGKCTKFCRCLNAPCK